jgi:phage/plasmid-like protein (TIGR03299 family)|tara:strand:+ start:1676 stop:2716 length:1041 start_codon:yes stop_codon:yes gene_type:complete
MSHEIDMSNGKANMMYVGEVPWHGLGQYVGDEAVTAEDAIVAAGLDWEVGCQPIFAEYDKDGSRIDIPNNFAVVRDDTLDVLGVVGNQYTPIQNKDCFGFMDALAGPERLVRYHTAGSLCGGRKIWLLAELTNLTFAPVPGDEVQPYLALIDGKDGRTNLMAFFTGTRVVCANTAAIAVSNAYKKKDQMVKIRHTRSAMGKLDEAKRVLGLAIDNAEVYAETMKALAKKQVNTAQWADLLDELMPLPEVKDEEKPGRSWSMTNNKREKLYELFESGVGTDIVGVRGTAWGAYNAITEFTTHHARVNAGDKDSDGYGRRRSERLLESSWFGSGNALNQKALDLLIGA